MYLKVPISTYKYLEILSAKKYKKVPRSTKKYLKVPHST